MRPLGVRQGKKQNQKKNQTETSLKYFHTARHDDNNNFNEK